MCNWVAEPPGHQRLLRVAPHLAVALRVAGDLVDVLTISVAPVAIHDEGDVPWHLAPFSIAAALPTGGM